MSGVYTDALIGSACTGLAAAILSSLLASGPNDGAGVLLLLVAIVGQCVVYWMAWGNLGSEFKNALATALALFLTFSIWYVGWGIALTVQG